jgi:hypothetical protein
MLEFDKPSPQARAYHRAVIGERLQHFGLITLSMKADHVREIYTWLASEAFAETCRLAELDAAAVSAKFGDLVEQGNRWNVHFAM